MTSIGYVRYNWIDWSKSIAIFLVIWGHIPMHSEIHSIIYSFHMPLFFLISGYLYTPRKTTKEEISKNLKTLILPYFIYQFIFYPYWIVREFIVPHQAFNIYDGIIQPIVQSLLSDAINGPTWFIYCLFLIKIYSHILQKKQSIYWYATSISCIFSIFICYWLNKQSIFGTYAIHNFFALQIFFFVGQALKRINIEDIVNSLRKSIIWFALFFFSFTALISMGYNNIYITISETVKFYALGFTGSAMIIGIGFILNRVKSNVNYNISVGTMVILGIHWMFIGVINFFIEKYLHITGDITYSSFTAFLISVFIAILNYPLIIICKKHLPLLLGKAKSLRAVN